MSTRPRVRQPGDHHTDSFDSVRPPEEVLRRALLGGVSVGGLIGALIVLPDGVEAYFGAEPETAYTLTWAGLLHE